MKRFLVIVPIGLLILLNACVTSTLPDTDAEWTAIMVTLTAKAWTPTIIPTYMYSSERSRIFGDLSSGIEISEVYTKSDQLEHILGATYQVKAINFLPENNTTTELQLDINCKCASDSHCCTPQRTFIVTVMAMNLNPNVLGDVPTTVVTLSVRCFQNDNLIGEVSAPWSDVNNFITGQVNGYELASKVTITP